MRRKSFDSFMKELPRFLRFVTCTTRKKEKPQLRALAVFREKEINRGKTAVPVRKQMEQSSSQRKFFRKKRIAFLGCPLFRLLSTFGIFRTISSYYQNHFLYPGQLLVKRKIGFPFIFNWNNQFTKVTSTVHSSFV